MHSTFLLHDWVLRLENMFGIDEWLKFKSLYEFGYPTKHGKESSFKKFSTIIYRIRLQVGGSKYLVMVVDSHPTYILFHARPILVFYGGGLGITLPQRQVRP